MSRHAPTISALTNIQDVAKNKVTNEMFLVCDMVPSSNEADIREAIARLKSSNREYGDASRAVSRWYLNKGSIQLSNESRRDRLILHQDVDESVQILNAKLVELGVEVESNLGNISSVASVTGISTNSNVAVSRCVNPAASEIGQASANQIQLDAVVCDGSINESVDLGPPVERLSIVAPSVVPSGAGNIQVPSSVAHVSSSATFHQANDYHISEMGMNNVQRLFQTNGPVNNRAPPAATMNTAFEDRRYGREDFPSCVYSFHNFLKNLPVDFIIVRTFLKIIRATYLIRIINIPNHLKFTFPVRTILHHFHLKTNIVTKEFSTRLLVNFSNLK